MAGTLSAKASAAKVLFVTQVIDPNDPVLGFTIGWARALAKRCTRFVVIANEVRVSVDGFELYSLGKELGHGRARRTGRLLRLLDGLSRDDKWTGLLAHMCPEYLVAVAPVARIHHIPLWLWYAHPSNTLRLRIAERLATGVLTSLPGSYPRPTRKIRVIGQATDLERFELAPTFPPRQPLRLLAIGRASPSKGYPTIVEAAARARSRGVDLRLRLIAPASTHDELSYRREITRVIEACDMADVTTLEGGLQHAAVPSVLQESHVLVNNMVPGSGDKVVFEAMATGRVVLASNASFSQLLAGLQPSKVFPANDAPALAVDIEAITQATDSDLARLGSESRRRVAEHHSLSHWAGAVVTSMLRGV